MQQHLLCTCAVIKKFLNHSCMMFALLASVLLHLCVCSGGLVLRCDQDSIWTCPNSSVSCECRARVRLIWRVTSTESSAKVFETSYDRMNRIEDSSSLNGYTGFLCNITEVRTMIQNITVGIVTLFSKLNFTISEDINVTCEDNGARSSDVPLKITSEQYLFNYFGSCVVAQLGCCCHACVDCV